MTKKLKRISIVALSLVIMALAVLSLTLFNKTKTVDATFLTTTENVSVEYKKSPSANFLGGRTGYSFSTSISKEKISLKEGMAGDFSIEFTPYSDVNGQEDFSKFAFTFKSPESRVYFSLIFRPNTVGTIMDVQLSNRMGKVVSVAMAGSFSNTSDKCIKFSFNPSTMTVKDADGLVVADFKSKEFLATYYVVDPLPTFVTYDVSMEFDGINAGKTAKVVIFDVCGQKLSGEQLVNSTAPIIYTTPSLVDGVVGVNYKVSTLINTFDMIDGFSAQFNGDIKVLNQKNQPIALGADYSFVPEQAGTYTVEYTPADAQGLKGKTTSVRFYVNQNQPDVEFTSDLPLSDMEIGVGSRVIFPKVNAFSKLSKSQIPVTAKVIFGTSEKLTADAGQGFNYTFDTLGNYVVEFTATDVSGHVVKKSINVVVSDIAVFTGVDFASNYSKDSIMNLDTATCSYNGQEVGQTTALTIFPSGKTSNAKYIVCDEEGLYTVVFSCTVDQITYSVEKNFNVKNDNVALWEATSGLILEADAVAPSYSDFAYNGIMMTTSRPAEATYKNIVNIADNTKDDLLCELFVAPTEANSREFSCIDIILTDANDSSKVLDIRLTKDPWAYESSKPSMCIMAQFKKDFTNEDLKESCKAKKENDMVLKYYYNSSVKSSFYGKFGEPENNYPSTSVKLYFDYEEGKLYAENATVKYQGYGKLCVADLNDESYVGVGNAWKGFSTGEVKISFKMSSIAKQAHMMILNVDGQAMAGKSTTDTTAPSIILDYAGNDANDLPNAVVGKTYKIFKPYSVDLTDGKTENVQVAVYKKNGAAMTEYPRNNMEFTPNAPGQYVIRYQTVDSSGNRASKDISITAVDFVDEMKYAFSENISKTYYVGQLFRYYDGVISGGTGAINKQVKITLGDEEIAMYSDGTFDIEKVGDYKIEVVLSDYVSQSEPFVYNFTVQCSPLPILEEKTMPEALVQGETFELPNLKGTIYTANSGEVSSQSIDATWYQKYETDADYVVVEQNVFVPDKDGVYLLKAKVQDSEKVYTVHVNAARENGFGYLAQFINSNAEWEGYTNSDKSDMDKKSALHYIFSEDAYFLIARKLNVDFATVNFGITKVVDENNTSKNFPSEFNSISITFVDSVDPSVKFTAVLTAKDNDESYLTVNGESITFFGSFEKPKKFNEFIVSYNEQTKSIIVNGVSLVVSKTDDGRDFNGFASQNVYLRVDVNGVKSRSKIGISSIAGQSIIPTTKMDITGPAIKVVGHYEDVYFGDYFEVLDAVIFDFMSQAKSIFVTVTSPSGKVLYNKVQLKDVEPILADEIGVYFVKYTAYDGLDRSSTSEIGVKIMDFVEPEITLSGKVPETAWAGSVITLPTMNVSDDHTATEDILTYVYYIAPNAEMVEVKGNSFVASMKGTYVIVYFAQDLDGATTTLYYNIKVS